MVTLSFDLHVVSVQVRCRKHISKHPFTSTLRQGVCAESKVIIEGVCAESIKSSLKSLCYLCYMYIQFYHVLVVLPQFTQLTEKSIVMLLL